MKPASRSYAVALAVLTKNPHAEYAEVAKAATKAKVKMFPIVYGRAKRSLGIAKTQSKKKLTLKLSPKPAARAKTIKRTARTVNGNGHSFGGSLEDVLTLVKEKVARTAQLERVLQKISEAIASV